MKIKKYKQSEKGFAIALALIMLLVMSLMGATLVMVAANDHKKNAIKDSSQQAFYAAETGITEAKKWLADPNNAPLKSQSDPSSNLKFCKTSSGRSAAISAISSLSVETITRSISLQDNAATIEKAIMGWPDRGRMFLPGTPLEPPRAGMIAQLAMINQRLFQVKAFGQWLIASLRLKNE